MENQPKNTRTAVHTSTNQIIEMRVLYVWKEPAANVNSVLCGGNLSPGETKFTTLLDWRIHHHYDLISVAMENVQSFQSVCACVCVFAYVSWSLKCLGGEGDKISHQGINHHLCMVVWTYSYTHTDLHTHPYNLFVGKMPSLWRTSFYMHEHIWSLRL